MRSVSETIIDYYEGAYDYYYGNGGQNKMSYDVYGLR